MKIDASMPLSRFTKIIQDLPCMQVSLLIQLRMGHVPLQKHLHRMEKVSSLRCPECHTRDETIHHYLMVCPAHKGLRSQMEKALLPGAWSIGTLLLNPKVFEHLFRYINATCRFYSMTGLNQ